MQLSHRTNYKTTPQSTRSIVLKHGVIILVMLWQGDYINLFEKTRHSRVMHHTGIPHVLEIRIICLKSKASRAQCDVSKAMEMLLLVTMR